ncbi:MAG: hypothetical protein R2854_31075 [Caldilineaceae bacterium]
MAATTGGIMRVLKIQKTRSWRRRLEATKRVGRRCAEQDHAHRAHRGDDEAVKEIGDRIVETAAGARQCAGQLEHDLIVGHPAQDHAVPLKGRFEEEDRRQGKDGAERFEGREKPPENRKQKNDQYADHHRGAQPHTAVL